MSVRPAKCQINLGIRQLWSESSLSAWRKLWSWATHWTHSEDSDHTGWMHGLIWVFAGCTVTFLVLSCRGSNFNIKYQHEDSYCNKQFQTRLESDLFLKRAGIRIAFKGRNLNVCNRFMSYHLFIYLSRSCIQFKHTGTNVYLFHGVSRTYYCKLFTQPGRLMWFYRVCRAPTQLPSVINSQMKT